MKIAYLINQYPFISHSFIRREIHALENLGLDIKRFSVRGTFSKIIDAADIEEYHKTTVILNLKILRLAIFVLVVFFQKPARFFTAVLKTVNLGIKSKAGLFKHFAYLIEACALKVLTGNAKIAHLHAHFGTNSTAVALLCHMLGGPPYSFTVHGPEEFDDPVGLAIDEKIKYSKFVLGVSEFGRSQLMRFCPPEFWHKIKIVRCGVDISFMDEIPTPVPDNRRMVCVGRLCTQKGQLLLLDALSLLKKQNMDFEMVFAGDGELRQMIQQKISDLNLVDNVKITGWLDEEDVKRYIRESRALVLPSFAEGLPVVIMEAFALARPVISTYIAGIPELVENNKNGYLVPAGSLERLADALRRVLTEDLPVLTAMGQAGREMVKKNHHVIHEAQKIKNLIFS